MTARAGALRRGRRVVGFGAALGLTIGTIFGMVGSSAVAEVVSTPPVDGSTASVSLAMDNDWQFVDSECLFIPVLATFGRADDTSVIGETSVSKVGSAADANEGTFLVLPGDPVAGELLDEVFVCPANGTGEYRLDTTISAVSPQGEESFPLDSLTFWVRPAVSTLSDLAARVTKGGTRVSGVVLAGDSVATGSVQVRLKVPGAKRWDLALSVPLEEGGFDAVIDESVPVGTRVKVTSTGCSWCSRARAVVRAS